MLTLKNKQGVFLAIAILCVLSCFVVRSRVFAQASDSSKTKRTSLLEERRDVLKTRVEIFEHLVKIASAPDELIAARNDLLDAEYELAISSDQRMSVLQQKHDNAKELEAVMLARKHDAKGTEADVLSAKARRLGIEIELLREQETHEKSQ